MHFRETCSYAIYIAIECSRVLLKWHKTPNNKSAVTRDMFCWWQYPKILAHCQNKMALMCFCYWRKTEFVQGNKNLAWGNLFIYPESYTHKNDETIIPSVWPFNFLTMRIIFHHKQSSHHMKVVCLKAHFYVCLYGNDPASAMPHACDTTRENVTL